MKEKSIGARLDEILPKITDKTFRENIGLGNEIGYYIFDYDAKDEYKVRDFIERNKNKINNDETNKYDFSIKEYDIYNIIMDLIEEKGFMGKIIDFEKRKGTDWILKRIREMLAIGTDNDLIINYIKENTKENDIVFLTGLGKASFIIRAHSILNNLHSVIDKTPVIMFYPGNYTGQTLELMGSLKGNGYYRAFQLVSRI